MSEGDAAPPAGGGEEAGRSYRLRNVVVAAYLIVQAILPINGFVNDKRYLLMDRDAKFCESFRETLRSEDVQSVRLLPRSPYLNAHVERLFGSLKSECLNRMIFFGEQSLRRALNEYVAHYNAERPHQGVGVKSIASVVPEREGIGGLGNPCGQVTEQDFIFYELGRTACRANRAHYTG